MIRRIPKNRTSDRLLALLIPCAVGQDDDAVIVDDASDEYRATMAEMRQQVIQNPGATKPQKKSIADEIDWDAVGAVKQICSTCPQRVSLGVLIVHCRKKGCRDCTNVVSLVTGVCPLGLFNRRIQT